ncbi:MAG: hypothetical protein M3015_10820 [Bacteroidota bacterium]|nr:hypothetical protein [Bacteroidota bacterium]
MNTFYTAYTKQVQGTKFYFVKRFSTFPEMKGMPDILENFGMHHDFKIACSIAKLNDPLVQENLFGEIADAESDQGKIIHMTALNAIKVAQ